MPRAGGGGEWAVGVQWRQGLSSADGRALRAGGGSGGTTR